MKSTRILFVILMIIVELLLTVSLSILNKYYL